MDHIKCSLSVPCASLPMHCCISSTPLMFLEYPLTQISGPQGVFLSSVPCSFPGGQSRLVETGCTTITCPCSHTHTHTHTHTCTHTHTHTLLPSLCSIHTVHGDYIITYMVVYRMYLHLSFCKGGGRILGPLHS